MLKNGEIAAWLGPQSKVDRSALQAVSQIQDQLETALDRLEKVVRPDAEARVSLMREQLNGFGVRISLIGQVKAGKTALTNAMIGRPSLLPSDVNPWTSVITSVHMNTPQPNGKNAVFSFFKTDEWNKMVEAGGHLGEMAERANYLEELAELKSQIQEMQERTKARLGKNFNLLLDSNHSFMGFSPALIKKYVCLGDDDDEAEGRYADVTKSAQLYINNDNYCLPTILCDTPGINDPFLLREAVTLENLGNTDICVVVLSAHQALGSVDIGLLRILMALKHEQLVLFVNRIDELSDPDRQIGEIDAYIRGLLKEKNLLVDIPVIFGSAAWAEVASAGSTEMIDDNATEALTRFATKREKRLSSADVSKSNVSGIGTTLNTNKKTSDLSGLYDLQNILQQKSAINVSLPYLVTCRDQALDLAHQSLLYLEKASASLPAQKTKIDPTAFADELNQIMAHADEACILAELTFSEQVQAKMPSAFKEFLSAEKANLRKHILAKNSLSDWHVDSDSLRRNLNSAHNEFIVQATQRMTQVFEDAAKQLEECYGALLGVNTKLFSITPPKPLSPKTPAALMRTMALDMNTSWFVSWVRSKIDPNSYIKKFEAITIAEMDATLLEMQEVYATAFVRDVRQQLREFLSEHIKTLEGLSMMGDDSQRAAVLKGFGVEAEIANRIEELKKVIVVLETSLQSPDSSIVTLNRSVA